MLVARKKIKSIDIDLIESHEIAHENKIEKVPPAPVQNVSEKVVNKLPPDTYPTLLQRRVELDETNNLILNIKRGGEYGLLMLELKIRTDTKLYQGYKKGGIMVGIDQIDELINQLKLLQSDIMEYGIKE